MAIDLPNPVPSSVFNEHPDRSRIADSEMRSNASLNDVLVFAALNGIDEEGQELITGLREARNAEVEAERVTWEMDALAFEERLKELGNERANAEARLAEISTESTKQQVIEDALLAELNARSSDISNLVSTLITRRGFYPIRLLTKRIQQHTVLNREVREQLLEEEEGHLEWEKRMHALLLERRAVNAVEADRRVALLREQQNRSQDELTEHESYVRALRRIGVTRWTAGFLFWAGYLGFVAVGWFLGEALHQVFPPSDSVLLALTTMFLEGLTGLFGALTTIPALLVIGLAPPPIIGMVAGVVWLTDKLMIRFDADWKKRRRRTGTRQQRGFWAWINDPVRDITRRDYAQTLARLPTFYFWALVPLLLAFLFSRSGAGSSAQLPDASASLLYTYFGVVLCVLFAGFALLYCTRIIEIRLRKSLVDGSVSVWKPVVANIELMVLLMVLGAVFVVWEILPNVASPWASSPLSVGMLLAILNALIVAYASMYRGVFRDLDLLRQEVRRYEEEIQKYSGAPLLEYDDEELSRFRDELKSLREELESAWKQVDHAARQTISIPWSFGIKVQERESSPGGNRPGVTGSDGILEPELVAELSHQSAHRDRLSAEVGRVSAKLVELETEAARIRQINWIERMDNVRYERTERRRDFRMRVERITRIRNQQIIEALSAWKSGSALRTTMKSAPTHSGEQVGR